MSGGHYDHAFGQVRDLADAIYGDVQKHSKPFTDDYGETVTEFPQPVLDAMRRCAAALEGAATAAWDVEWLMSGDCGEDSFLEAAKEWKIPDSEKLLKRIATLELALSEAMSVRHFCDMEQQPEPDDPYRYDACLQKWARALGRKVESNWPKPGIKDQDDGKGDSTL